MKPTITGFLLILFLATQPACATSRAARPLEIRSDKTDVLGCIPVDEGDTVDVADAGVSPIKGGEQTPSIPWQITLGEGNQPIKLNPGECLAYRKLPAGYTDTIQPSELRSGWPYSFSIRSAEWGKHGTRIHTGTFCLGRVGSDIKVVQVPRTSAAISAATCRQLLGAPNSP